MDPKQAHDDDGRTLNLFTPPDAPGPSPPRTDGQGPGTTTHRSAADDAGSTQVSSGSTGDPPTGDRHAGDLPSQISQIESGMVLLNKYRVVKRLGEGGMGAVWLVRHLEFDVDRVIKVINPALVGRKELRRRFSREAKLMARLNHPHAVIVHDTGVANGVPFIEMEYIQGQSLRRSLVHGQPRPLAWVVRIALQLCDVLAEAHRLGIVHRDLKPENVMLLADRAPGQEFAKVLDFGIAKLVEQGGPADSELATGSMGTQGFLGTAAYASPEQINGGAIDARSDLYSLGVMLYELLTGHRPFEEKTIAKLLMAQSYHEPPEFGSHPGVEAPPAIEKVVLRCLAKDPEDRPTSADALRQLLLDAAYTVLTPSEIFLDLATPPPLPEPPSGQPRPQKRRDSHPDLNSQLPAPTAWPRIALWAAVTAAALVAAGLLIWTYRPEPVTRPAEPESSGEPKPPPTPASLLAYFKDHGYRPAEGADRDAEGVPSAIVRAEDERRFVRHGNAYLPEGYAPVTDAGATEGLPTAIVRDDGTRFMLVLGTDRYGFAMGAPDAFGGMTTLDEERPPHSVPLSSYYMQQHEVRIGEIEAFLDGSDAWDRAGQELSTYRQSIDELREARAPFKEHPAVGITRALAEAYAHHVRGELPSEAQWEYAARSRGQDRPFVWGFDEDKSQANIDSAGAFNLTPTYETTLTPAERRENRILMGDVTAQEIVDLAGNVREWCRDAYGPYLDAPMERDFVAVPPDPETAKYVIRGGSFDTPFPETARTTWRANTARHDYRGGLHDEAPDLGFRVVVEFLPLPSATPTEGLAE